MKMRMARLRTEKEDARMEAEKAIEEKKQAMSKVDKVSHSCVCSEVKFQHVIVFAALITWLATRFIFNIVQLECDVAGLERTIKLLETDLENAEGRIQALNSAAEVEFVNNLQRWGSSKYCINIACHVPDRSDLVVVSCVCNYIKLYIQLPPNK